MFTHGTPGISDVDKYSEMLESMGITNDTTELFSESQKKALELFKSGKNVFIHGFAGTGKSFLLKYYKEYTVKNTNKTISVTATTGIAAYNINGITINRYAGIRTGEQPVKMLLKYVNSTIRETIRKTDILVIDEISMMSADLFEKLDELFRYIRKRQDELFGGIQLVLCGDLLQLLPVFTRNTELYGDQDTRLLVESPLFNKHFKGVGAVGTKKANIISLEQNFRQENDKKFNDLLARLRYGKLIKEDEEMLQSRVVDKIPRNVLHLVSSNNQAQEINEKNINMLKQVSCQYKPSFLESSRNDITKILRQELDTQFKQRGLDNLVLKNGCRVMLVKNLDVANGLVNGATGTVVEMFGSKVKVLFDGGVTEFINPVSWKVDFNGSSVSATQIPLIVAYALTIHKSQSLTLDNVIIDLGDSIFCEHQSYVALSRAKCLDRVYITNLSLGKIKVNNKIIEFLNTTTTFNKSGVKTK